jgi:hypothetical protein
MTSGGPGGAHLLAPSWGERSHERSVRCQTRRVRHHHKLIPARQTSRTLRSSRPAEGSISRRPASRAGCRSGFQPYARPDNPRLATPTPVRVRARRYLNGRGYALKSCAGRHAPLILFLLRSAAPAAPQPLSSSCLGAHGSRGQSNMRAAPQMSRQDFAYCPSPTTGQKGVARLTFGVVEGE